MLSGSEEAIKTVLIMLLIFCFRTTARVTISEPCAQSSDKQLREIKQVLRSTCFREIKIY